MAVITAMSQTWISATSFKQVVGNAIPAKHGAEWFERFWNSFWWLFVKGFHVGEFFVLTILASRALRVGKGWSAGESILGAALVAGVFAMVDEIHQHFIAYRGGRWTDVMIDLGGVGLACALLVGLNRRSSRANVDTRP